MFMNAWEKWQKGWCWQVFSGHSLFGMNVNQATVNESMYTFDSEPWKFLTIHKKLTVSVHLLTVALFTLMAMYKDCYCSPDILISACSWACKCLKRAIVTQSK